METPELKQTQLDFRQAEMEETVRVIKDINQGYGKDIFARNPRLEGTELKSWKDRLDVHDMTVGGHSYGATLAVLPLD